MITAYISATNAPLSSQDDFIIDLNGGDSLPVDVPLYAAAVDSEDPSATFTFSWHLLRKPEGSGASLSSSQLANVTLEGVDVWGNYLLFCIATNTASGATSERDPLVAGPSAYVGVIVKSERLALVKPAPGERDWFSNYFDLVDVVENTIANDIADHETRITTLEGATVALALDELSDVSLSSPISVGESLVYNGSSWINQVVSGGSGVSSELSIVAGEDSSSISLETESLGFESANSNIVITGNTLTAGQYSVNFELAGTIDSDTTGNAATSTTSTTSSRLANSRAIAVSGAVSGSANFDGSADISIVTSIADGSIANAKLANTGITFNNGASSEQIALGGEIAFEGTASEVDVSYSSANNTFSFGLPDTISADLSGNATSADALSTARTIALTGGATGSGSFDGSANLSIATSLRTATGSARGGVILESGTGNSSAYALRREQQTVMGTVYATHYVPNTTDNHVIDHDGIDSESSAVSNVGLRSCVVFRNPFPKKDAHIDMISLVMLFGGETEGGQDYEFELVNYANLNALLNNTHTAYGLTMTPTRVVDNGPIGFEADYTTSYNGPIVSVGEYVGIFVTAAPKNLGHALNAQITFSREIGA